MSFKIGFEQLFLLEQGIFDPDSNTGYSHSSGRTRRLREPRSAP